MSLAWPLFAPFTRKGLMSAGEMEERDGGRKREGERTHAWWILLDFVCKASWDEVAALVCIQNCCSIFSFSHVLLSPTWATWAPGLAAKCGTEPLICKSGRKEAIDAGLVYRWQGRGTWNVNEDGSLKHAFVVSVEFKGGGSLSPAPNKWEPLIEGRRNQLRCRRLPCHCAGAVRKGRTRTRSQKETKPHGLEV